MSDYTPETGDVRDFYTFGMAGWDHTLHYDPEAYAEFDRWLAQHDREVAAQALRDAASSTLPFSQVISGSTDPSHIPLVQTLPVFNYNQVTWLRAEADRIEAGE